MERQLTCIICPKGCNIKVEISNITSGAIVDQDRQTMVKRNICMWKCFACTRFSRLCIRRIRNSRISCSRIYKK